MELNLDARDAVLYAKLYASLSDIAFARQCAEHIRQKGWNRRPWSRGSGYFQQSAFVTSLVVSYGRPFASSRGQPNFPQRLLPYDAFQRALHDLLMQQRNQIYAHSDLEHWTVRPWRSEDIETTIVGQPILALEPDQITGFLTMTESLIDRIRERMSALRSAGPPSAGSMDI